MGGRGERRMKRGGKGRQIGKVNTKEGDVDRGNRSNKGGDAA